MSDLRIRPVESEAEIADWQHVHNAIIPADPLSLDEVRERVHRNHLEVAYHDDVLVGCTTVRPPKDTTATVIVRVLPAHRGHGFGTQLYVRAMARARRLGADRIESIIWASNVDGLRFARARGFVEMSSELLPGAEVAYLTLRLA